MKNQILLGVFGLLLPTTLAAQTLQHTIKGSIKNGKAKGMVYLIQGYTVKDSMALNNGIFLFQSTLKEPGEATIVYDHGGRKPNLRKSTFAPGTDYLKIFLGGGETSVVTTDSLQYAKVSGGAWQEEFMVYRKALIPTERRNAIFMTMVEAITEEQAKDEALVARVKKEQQQIQMDGSKAKAAYAKSNPTSLFTLDILRETLYNPHKLAEVKSMLEAMPERVKQTKRGQDLANQLAQRMEADPTWEQNIALDKRLVKLAEQHALGTSEQQKIILAEYMKLTEQRKQTQIQYIKDHPDSPFNFNIIDGMALMAGYEELKILFDALTPKAQASEKGKKIADRLVVLERSKTGQKMIDFTQKDQNGKDVQWADFKGKYVFVDFWASWCGPCRAENPNVLKAYNNYKDKNFTVLGVSLDENLESWKKAIEQDKMPWTQISQNGWKNELATHYGIVAIPSTLLIDPQGVIIAANLRGEQLQEKLAEILK